MFLFVFWLRNRSSIKYVHNQRNGRGSSEMRKGAYRGRGVSHLMCTYALTLSLFIFLSYGVLFYLQKFNHTFIQKGYVCQKQLFFSNEINFCCNDISLFCFKLVFRTKVSQNAFIFNQIECFKTLTITVVDALEQLCFTFAQLSFLRDHER